MFSLLYHLSIVLHNTYFKLAFPSFEVNFVSTLQTKMFEKAGVLLFVSLNMFLFVMSEECVLDYTPLRVSLEALNFALSTLKAV